MANQRTFHPAVLNAIMGGATVVGLACILALMLAMLVGCGSGGVPPMPPEKAPVTKPLPVQPVQPPAQPVNGTTWFMARHEIVEHCAITSAQVPLQETSDVLQDVQGMFAARPDTKRVILLYDDADYAANRQQYQDVVAYIRSMGADVVVGIPWDGEPMGKWLAITYPDHWAPQVTTDYDAAVTPAVCSQLSASWATYSKLHNL